VGATGATGPTGADYAPVVAGKNFLLNADFSIWQRGTSFTSGLTTPTSYTADRWVAWNNANGQVTRQASDLANFRYFVRYQRAAGATATDGMSLVQNLETAQSIPLAGKTVTLSVWARKGANFSPTSGQFVLYLFTGTGTDQNYASYTGQASTSALFTPTTSWQRFSFTTTVPANATEVAPVLGFAPSGTAGAADYMDWAGVQLEIGSVATPFTTATGTIQGELAACQRYYYRHTYLGSGQNSPLIGPAYARTTGIAFATWVFPVPMRVTPTLAFANATAYFSLSIGGGDATFSTLSSSSVPNTAVASLRADAGSHTVGQAGVLGFNNAAAWIEASAEL
jgi:hypothetical protein